MERYKQRFTGVFAPLIKSDFGDWCKYEEFEVLLKGNEDALFDVIKERNLDIEELKKECQRAGDDNEELILRNTKLFSLLVISSTLNLITIAIVTLTMMGKI